METIDHEEFEKRLVTGNDRLRQELAEAQERVRQLEVLIHRKEAFAEKLDRILSEIERDEAEIAEAESKLRLTRSSVRQRSHIRV
ncbi:MAG: hypothetical protein OHK0029_15410 [Armatimonadaceae bacterium]